jgi:hypothetical protein
MRWLKERWRTPVTFGVLVAYAVCVIITYALLDAVWPS